MNDPQLVVAAVLGVVQLSTTVVLFLVGRLLSSNRQAVDELRGSLKEVSLSNHSALVELTRVIETLRNKMGSIEVAVARLEVVTNMKESNNSPRSNAS